MFKAKLIVLMALLLMVIYITADDFTIAAQHVEKPFILDPTYSVTQIIRPSSWFIVEVRDPSGVFTPGLATATLSCYISGLINISLKVNGYSSQAGRHSINFSAPMFELPVGGFYPCSLVISDGRNLF